MLDRNEVAEYLEISISKVDRLRKEKYLKVNYTTRVVSIYGSNEKLWFEESQVEYLREKLPSILEKWERIKERNRRKGYKHAVKTRRRNRKRLKKEKQEREIRIKELRENKIRFMRSLEDYSSDIRDLLRCCYFLFHLNHYAHFYRGKDESKSKELFSMKDRVLQAMKRQFEGNDILKLVFVDGDDKPRCIIELCEECKEQMHEDYKDDRERYYYDFGYYIGCHSDTHKCPYDECFIEESVPKYYALFEFNVEHETHKFCFHIPYSKGVKWFGAYDHLPQRQRNDGSNGDRGFLYGRAITSEETAVVGEEEAVQQVEEFMVKYEPYAKKAA